MHNGDCSYIQIVRLYGLCGSLLTMCVGLCCRESSWLGVCHMLPNEGLVVGCVGGYLLYSRVCRKG